MSASISLRPQISRNFPSRTRVKLPIHPSSVVFHPSSSPLSPQTPSLPGADPRSGRPRCAGRESKFLAAWVESATNTVTLGLLWGAQDALWVSFQNGIVSFINKQGGNASILPKVIKHVDWDTTRKRYYRPTEDWIKDVIERGGNKGKVQYTYRPKKWYWEK